MTADESELAQLVARRAELDRLMRDLNSEIKKIKGRLADLRQNNVRATKFQQRVQAIKRYREMYAMHESGQSYKKIAKHFQRCIATVTCHVHDVERDLREHGATTPEQQAERQMAETMKMREGRKDDYKKWKTGRAQYLR